MLKIEIPKDRKKLEQQISALRYQISIDTNEKDRKIHKESLLEMEQEWRSRYE